MQNVVKYLLISFLIPSLYNNPNKWSKDILVPIIINFITLTMEEDKMDGEIKGKGTIHSLYNYCHYFFGTTFYYKYL